jgi:sialic acid synthase SpsE/quercetin dioxygenase-like cupin family protein
MQSKFKNLFILDLANNHFGDLGHAKKIIKEFSLIANKKKIKATIKFQLRDYNSYIHRDYIKSDDKYVRRFLDTRLSIKDFEKLFLYVKQNKLLTSCTPFDEKSVDIIEKFKFDYLKIASVSAGDFSLLKRIVKNKIPKIISTGGLEIGSIDKIVRLMKKYNQNFALMHCISIYPSNNEDLQLLFIKLMKKRYPDISIGWSTHEDPNSFLPSSIAKACGAEMFERHIGIDTNKYKLNKYSMQPHTFERYLNNLKDVKNILGYEDSKNKKILLKERKTLKSLQRGLYAKKNLERGTVLNDKNSYLAFPLNRGQISADMLKNGSKIMKKISANSQINIKNVKIDEEVNKDFKIWSYIHTVKGILNENKIIIGDKFEMEISHHKGIENFHKTGCYLFNLVNKEYAKKIIVMLPNQSHPSHHHKIKDETFYIISGKLTLLLNGKKKILKPGDIIDVKKNSKHRFKAGSKGCIFDEISTKSIKSDSYYIDPKIKKMKRYERKTIVKSWI